MLIRLQLYPAGKVVRADTVERDRLGDPAYRAVATAAVRAILQCQPLTLPASVPAGGQGITLSFAP